MFKQIKIPWLVPVILVLLLIGLTFVHTFQRSSKTSQHETQMLQEKLDSAREEKKRMGNLRVEGQSEADHRTSEMKRLTESLERLKQQKIEAEGRAKKAELRANTAAEVVKVKDATIEDLKATVSILAPTLASQNPQK